MVVEDDVGGCGLSEATSTSICFGMLMVVGERGVVDRQQLVLGVADRAGLTADQGEYLVGLLFRAGLVEVVVTGCVPGGTTGGIGLSYDGKLFLEELRKIG